jgi:hypothetical protein
VPTSEVLPFRTPKKKPPEGGSISLDTLIVNHTVINAGFDFRR